MERRRPRSRRARMVAGLLAVALASSGAACSRGGSAPPTASDSLPHALALRSDTPYIAGTITSRTQYPTGLVRVRVKAPESAESARVGEADVTAHPDSLTIWRDGQEAGLGDLQVGRAVVVWVNGPELRSLPPQVTASAILLER